MPPSYLRYLVLSLAASPLLSHAASVESNWKVCPPTPISNTTHPQLERPQGLDAQAIYVEADDATLRQQGDSYLQGNVFIADNKQSIQADSSVFNNQTQQVRSTGNVQLKGELLELNSESIDYNLGSQTGEILSAYYRLPETDARGTSARILREGKRLTQLEAASYTTCPPNDESWKIQSSQIELRHEQNLGLARNVTLKVKNVPVFYFPYFSFPLGNQRKSGFLTPSFKQDENAGIQVSLPYYFNLAPNYDLTLTPIMLSKRGMMLASEFRYLQPDHEGKLFYNVLPRDQAKLDTLRYQFDLNYKRQFEQGKKGTLTIKAGGVSDKEYLTDFGGSLAATSTINLERNISYSVKGRDWSFSALAQDFQVLDTGIDPYSRLPQLTLNYKLPQKPAGFEINTSSEFTHFYSGNQNDAKRLHVNIKASHNIARSWGHFRSTLSLNHTQYQFEDSDTDNHSASRTLPTLSFDAGLIFERNLDKYRIQTLEPRAFYTYTPFREQSHIPLFDSGEKSINYNTLFTENRFTGKDRFGDTNRLTTSITTRIQDSRTGQERLRFSAGQILYFDNRQVTLPNKSAETGKRSELVFETSGQINDRTRLTGTAFYDTSLGKFNAGQLELNYKDAKGRALNLGYGSKRDDFSAVNTSFTYPIADKWKVAGSWNYDVENNRTLETISGLEYQSCCWKTRVAARKYLLPDNTTYESALYLELELKGLGSVGNNTRDLLRNRITGYE